jgi:MerR family transcriptional regulator/heat shock protein HspR
MSVRKRKEVSPIRPETPIYPIGVAARILDVHPRTLRIYEAEGLVAPEVEGRRRLFSDNDIVWIRCLRAVIHGQGISIPGIKRLLELIPCAELRECGKEDGCPAAFPEEMRRELARMRKEKGSGSDAAVEGA